MIRAGKLLIPDGTKAVLWDMDGVLLDSLGFDALAVNQLLKKFCGLSVVLSQKYLKSIFAYDPLTFWQLIFREIRKSYGIVPKRNAQELIYKEYSRLRTTGSFPVCPGIVKILSELDKLKIKQAVVSNNPAKEVKAMLKRVGIANKFERIIGNDMAKIMAKKPAPDAYLFAIEKMKLVPKECVIIEDTEIGVRAGKAAGCFTVAVATGGATKYQLQKMRPKADKIYLSFS
jgi:HAD superfamily hydrolase (TIGR01509 family)